MLVKDAIKLSRNYLIVFPKEKNFKKTGDSEIHQDPEHEITLLKLFKYYFLNWATHMYFF